VAVKPAFGTFCCAGRGLARRKAGGQSDALPPPEGRIDDRQQHVLEVGAQSGAFCENVPVICYLQGYPPETGSQLTASTTMLVVGGIALCLLLTREKPET
jgi:hypothetical protein